MKSADLNKGENLLKAVGTISIVVYAGLRCEAGLNGSESWSGIAEDLWLPLVAISSWYTNGLTMLIILFFLSWKLWLDLHDLPLSANSLEQIKLFTWLQAALWVLYASILTSMTLKGKLGANTAR